MAKSLVIVESPAKAKTINKFLGKDYKVTASMGHVRDLPLKELGVDLENRFSPTYVSSPDKEKTITQLSKLAEKSESIFLAPDPDREGEAISWHLAELLKEKTKDKQFFRIVFNEITKTAVKSAIENPSEINMDLVNAQQARRILDRLVGYKISPMLTRMVARNKSSLSAGRVQSVALRMICEREAAIRAFKPVEYWTIHANYTGKGKTNLSAELFSIEGKRISHQGEGKDEKEDDKYYHIKTDDDAKSIVEEAKDQTYEISKITRRKKSRRAPAPYITSTLQQDASRLLGFTGDRTMRIAQALYEGINVGEETVGLITYMRTDSVRIAGDAVGAVRGLIEREHGKDYVPEKPTFFKTRKSAQDAHECIRPTMLDMKHAPETIRSKLTQEQFKLYDMIWKRFLACQMPPAQYESTTIDILGGRYTFRASGSVLLFDGYTKMYRDEDEEKDQRLPKMDEGDSLKLKSLDPNQHFTKPPARYNDASLVKALESEGIGRPSTYASIVKTIVDRKYVLREEKRFYPTDLGEVINKLLLDNFPDIFELRFTSDIENQLDEVEEGRIDWTTLLERFYDPFAKDLENAPKGIGESLRSLQEETDNDCPKCGKTLLKKWGRTSWFLACSGYPDCDYSASIDEPDTVKTEIECKKCSNPMLLRPGQYGGYYLSCSNYPDCKTTMPLPTGIKCFKCGGDVVRRRSRRGIIFFGCGNYPDCDFVAWDPPIMQPCPNCDSKFLVFKNYKRKGPTIKCPEKECGYSRPADLPNPVSDDPFAAIKDKIPAEEMEKLLAKNEK